jgi:four helix bundle protein
MKKKNNYHYLISPMHHDIAMEYEEGYNENKDFTTLEAWKKAKDVKLFLYKEVLKILPFEEKHNLAFQIRKASVSSTANIAEGYGRYHYGEAIQFYRISRGSLYELKDHLISCLDLNYISEKDFDRGISLIETAKRTLNGYITYVKSLKKNSPDKN